MASRVPAYRRGTGWGSQSFLELTWVNPFAFFEDHLELSNCQGKSCTHVTASFSWINEVCTPLIVWIILSRCFTSCVDWGLLCSEIDILRIGYQKRWKRVSRLYERILKHRHRNPHGHWLWLASLLLSKSLSQEVRLWYQKLSRINLIFASKQRRRLFPDGRSRESFSGRVWAKWHARWPPRYVNIVFI